MSVALACFTVCFFCDEGCFLEPFLRLGLLVEFAGTPLFCLSFGFSTGAGAFSSSAARALTSAGAAVGSTVFFLFFLVLLRLKFHIFLFYIVSISSSQISLFV
jgi:hypothetical protein